LKIDVLNVRFDNLTRRQAAQLGERLLREAGFHYVVTPNPEFLLMAQRDADFLQALNGADLVIPDGIGVVYSGKILGTPFKERVPGIDFGEDMLACLNELGGRLYLLGAKPGVAEQAACRLLERHPNIILCGTHDGYFQDDEAMMRKVSAANPDLLLVCLGAPRQEKWMARWGKHTGAKLAIGMGGALDVLSGNVQRAPEVWQKLNLEWAYRLIKQPQRALRMAKLPLVLVKAAAQRSKRGRA
jgi:N-acetylglucosaminyldiphosphoundecaprenol N-acetyl-beta-D-mannosaminyltransferase